MNNINDFKQSLAFVLKWEVGNKPNGGLVNDPDDPGGVTKWGIDQRDHPGVDVPNLTPEQATQIYSQQYWDACGCDSIPFPFCTVIFDSAVNDGVGRAKDWLRKSNTVDDYLTLRKNYYLAIVQSNPSQQRFFAGWMARVADLQKLVVVDQQNQDASQKWGGLG